MIYPSIRTIGIKLYAYDKKICYGADWPWNCAQKTGVAALDDYENAMTAVFKFFLIKGICIIKS